MLRLPRVERRDDGTAHGSGGLSPWWKLGSVMHKLMMRCDGALGTDRWDEALRWATSLARTTERQIGELQVWGHGGFGFMRLGETTLDHEALGRRSPIAAELDGFREVLLGSALVWLRCCSAFGAAAGAKFAPELAGRLHSRVAGHTYIIGGFQSGTHSISPGDAPSWSLDEGTERRGGAVLPLESSWRAPHTISCLRPGLPDGW